MAVRPQSKRGGKTASKKKATRKPNKKAAKKKKAAKHLKKTATRKAKKKTTRKASKKSARKARASAPKATRGGKQAPLATRAKSKVTRPSRAPGATATVSRAKHAATVARLYPTRIGTVAHYYADARAAIVRLDHGELQVGDAVHIRGHTTDFYERIEELKVEDRTVKIARAGQTVGIRLERTVRENDGVFLLSD